MKNCSNIDKGCPSNNPQPLDNFNKNKTMKDGYAYECRECMRLYRKEHRKTEQYKQSRKRWEQENPESVKLSKSKDRNKNKEKYSKYNKEYYQKNRLSIREKENKKYNENKEERHKQQKLRREKNIIVYTYASYRNRAKKRGLAFELSLQEFSDIVCKPCQYCLKFINVINGIDRVDNKSGYTINNCVPCCKICNRMKLDMTYEDFIAHVFRLYDKVTDKVGIDIEDL